MTLLLKGNALYNSREKSDNSATDTSVCIVVPAYNESRRIGAVLDTLNAASCVTEVIVVDDGSLDGTAEVVEKHDATKNGKVRLIRHFPNRGKGAAMRAGAEATNAPTIVFFDADLIGLKPEHVKDLIEPVAFGNKSMALGVFRGGRGATTLAQILAPNISGQRAIRRDVFLQIPRLTESGYGVELAITSYVLGEGLPIARVVLHDVTHPMKEEKLGLWRGAYSRCRMYYQMLPFILRQRRRRARKGRKRP